MTRKPRQQATTETANTTSEPVQGLDRAPEPAPIPVDPAAARLAVLRDYAGPAGLLSVVVVVAHDAVFAGQHLRMPVTDRVAGLVELGFLEVEPTDPGGRL